MVQIVPTLVKEPRVSVQCPHCSVQLEYAKSQTPSTSTDFELSCAKCQHTFGPPSSSTGSSGKAQQRRRIGTQAAPLDTTYYDLLEVPIDADLEAIKKSYRRKALRHHPDKLPQGIPEAKRLEAEEHFKNLSAAYAVLSNPEERKKYNEFGPKGAQSAEGAMMDPEAVFSSLFGGDKFQDLIGKISIGAELKSSLQKEQEAQDSGDGDKLEDTKAAATKSRKDMTPEERAKARAEAEAKREKERKEAAERAKVREERVLELKDKLLKKMSIFTEQATSPTDAPVCRSVRAIWSIEAEELKMESYGVELLHSIGLGGWWSGMKQTANTFSETVSTLRSAYELTDIFKELSAAEEKGLSDEKRKELEEKAATKGIQALFRGCKLEVESVLREVCERVLYDEKQKKEVLDKRAAALEILGEVYSSVKKDDTTTDFSDYVNINPSKK